MGLDKIFQEKAEKVEEKKLQVVVSDESVEDKILAEALNYFNRSSPTEEKELKDDFKVYTDYLQQNYKIKPSLVSKINESVDSKKFDSDKKCYLGIFLSAMIQTSYNQGFNDFVFDKIHANLFGSLLKGVGRNKIRIKANIIKGNGSLGLSKNCYFIVKKIEGLDTLIASKNCVAEITHYKGGELGWGMRNCRIYSTNRETIEKIKREHIESMYGLNRSNKFLIKPTEKNHGIR